MQKTLRPLIYSLTLIFLMGCSNKSILRSSVVIDAPISDVWDYNGNDENAKNWSIFFAKIVPCPTTDCPENKKFLPGQVGSIRRCFRNENEKGVFWDEVTLESTKNEKAAYRKILTHNINGYDFESLKTKAEFVVEQTYTSLNENQTELSFSVKLQEPSKLRINNDEKKENNTSFWDHLTFNLIFKLGEKRTVEILTKNLQNIKLAIEQKEKYIRKHPYSKYCDIKNFWCSKKIADY